MDLLREVKGDAEFPTEEEITVKVGDKKVTVKVQDETTAPTGKRQLLVE